MAWAFLEMEMHQRDQARGEMMERTWGSLEVGIIVFHTGFWIISSPIFACPISTNKPVYEPYLKLSIVSCISSSS
jgi:hypothetical protein